MLSHFSKPSRARRPLRRVIHVLVTLALAVLSLPLLMGSAQAVTIGGFEVDGNQVSNGDMDWATLNGLGQVSVVHDPVGTSDASVFDGGDSESKYPNWGIGSPGTPSGKSDIGNVLVGHFKSGGDTWAAFGWDRAGDTGTGRYYIELNQKKSSGVVPNRTAGDVRITVGINGSDLLACQTVETWNGSAWSNGQSCGDGTFTIAVNDSTITDLFSSPNDPLEANTFLEGVINLSELGLTTCPVAGFQSIHFRSQEGGETGDTSALKDFATGEIDIPSDCGSITINKTVDGSAPGNATFKISPDPEPGSGQGAGSYAVVTTGSDGTVTVVAMPGVTYSVRELAPPANALLPATTTKTLDHDLADGEHATFTFNDPTGTLTFTKAYEGTPPADKGATFTVTRTQKWSYDTDPSDGISAPTLVAAAGKAFNVTDNGKNDTDPTMGVITVDPLQGGEFTIAETSPPDGWKADPANPASVTATIGPDATNKDAVLNKSGDPATFNNLLRPIALKVVKTESVPGVPEDTAYLSGVTFDLYADDGNATFGPEDTWLASGTTDANGEILFSNLTWQQDYWLDETVPGGYTADPVSPIFVDVDQATPPKNDTTVLTQQVDNKRGEFSIDFTKVDGKTGDPLEGAAFELYRENDPGSGFNKAEDTLVGSDTSGADGIVSFDKSGFQIPWGYTYYVYESQVPDGYFAMDPNPIVVDGTSSSLTDTTVHLGKDGLVSDPRKPIHLTLVKHVDNGSTDGTATVADFPLKAAGPTTIEGVSGTADVTNKLVEPGTYTLSEQMNAAGYSPGSWTCETVEQETVAVTQNQITLKLGDDVTCQITNTAQPGTLVYSKSSVPAPGSTVMPGDTVTYTVTVKKTGGVDPTDVVISDDLSQVLDNATYVDGSINASTGSAQFDGDVLKWTIPVLSGTETLSYQVTVDAGQWNQTLHNVVTGNKGACDPQEVCETRQFTPHWTLFKTSDPVTGATVVPGDQVDYTLTAHNDSSAVMVGATVTDDLSDVFDNATYVAGSIAGDGTADIVGDTLTWTLPTMQPGDTVYLHYSVTVNASQWNQTLVNVATPGQTSGDCVPPGCSTTQQTPPVTTLVVKKVDFDTGEVLAGSTFQLWLDNPPYFDSSSAVGAEDTAIGGPQVTGADGLATWGELLEGTHLIVEETAAPDGYGLPPDPLMGVVIDEGNFVPMGEMSQLLFRDPANGQLVLLPKSESWDSTPGKSVAPTWTPITVPIPYGSTVKYEIGVEATGKKVFHDVTVTDYVPGYNPDDVSTTTKATYLEAYKGLQTSCVGFTTCQTSFDPSTGLVTWYLGDLQEASGSVIFYVGLAPLPDGLEVGIYSEYYWNQAYLDWYEVTPENPEAQDLRASFQVRHRLGSNEVTAQTQASVLPESLPPTGMSGLVQWGGLLAGSLLVLGGWLVITEIRRRRVSD